MYNIFKSIEHHYENHDLPRLVSYPRTGSHWLRIILEAYLEMPCGPQAFLFPDNDPWGIHVHDRAVGQGAHQEGPITHLKKVIYLHRDPVNVIFSQFKYEGRTSVAESDVEKLICEYAAHLQRWRFDNTDVGSILDITYEEIKLYPPVALTKIIKFLDYTVDDLKITSVCNQVDKELTKKMTPHDPRALNTQALLTPDAYKAERAAFSAVFANKITDRFKGLR